MDWSTRKVLSWRVSNTMDVEFCIEALEEALARFRRPDIFNTDQGSQFTSPRFTGVQREAGVRISMDGRGRWMDNVFIERLWRSLKYECIYLHAFETGSELRAGLTSWIGYYNARRPHSTLAGRAPDEGIYGNWDGEIGGLTTIGTELNQAAKLSSRWGPPHFVATPAIAPTPNSCSRRLSGQRRVARDELRGGA